MIRWENIPAGPKLKGRILASELCFHECVQVSVAANREWQKEGDPALKGWCTWENKGVLERVGARRALQEGTATNGANFTKKRTGMFLGRAREQAPATQVSKSWSCLDEPQV